jgi:hypothetical protein
VGDATARHCRTNNKRHTNEEEDVTQHIKNMRDMPRQFSPAVIENILKLVKPKPDQVTQCQYDIVTIAYMIETLPDYVPPSAERRLLQDAVAKLQAAQAAIEAVPWQSGGQLQRLAGPVITETADRAAKLAARITVKHGNGSPRKHTIALQKQIAAEKAVDLLRGRKLTTASDGVLNRTAVALFELGTGQALTERACEKACARALAQALSIN